MSRAEAFEKHRQADEAQKLTKTHVCNECGGPLVAVHDPDQQAFQAVCASDRSHHSYRSTKGDRHIGFGMRAFVGPDFAAPPMSALRYVDSLYDRQMRRIANSPLPLAVQRALEWDVQSMAASWQASHRRREPDLPPPARTPREWHEIFLDTGQQQVWDCMVRHQAEKGAIGMESKALVAMSVDRMLKRIEGARFPQQMNMAERRNLAELAIYYGLDPAFGELMLYQGRPYISIDGRRRKALETGLLDGMSTRPATKEEREAWGMKQGDLLWFCDVYRKGCQRPFTAHGRVRLAETAAPKDKTKAGFRPLEVDPETMAAKRAEGRALKMAFADSISLPSLEGVGDVEEEEGVIEGEAREVPEVPEDRPPVAAGREEIRSDRSGPDTEPAETGGSQLPVVDPERVDRGTGEVPEDEPVAAEHTGGALPMETLQDLFAACQSVYGVKNWGELLTHLRISNKTQIADVKDAWSQLQQAFAESGGAARPKSEDQG